MEAEKEKEEGCVSTSNEENSKMNVKLTMSEVPELSLLFFSNNSELIIARKLHYTQKKHIHNNSRYK